MEIMIKNLREGNNWKENKLKCLRVRRSISFQNARLKDR